MDRWQHVVVVVCDHDAQQFGVLVEHHFDFVVKGISHF